jgi:N utilization substance protein A
VVIKAAVREPGERAKIAVVSNERDVDPVGACVGMKGSRVQSIIRELRGEKIDIIEWSEDPAIFAANGLSPAKVSKVTVLDFEDKKLQVTVENEQQSLAIGKRGQNVRLAAKLVGWDIDIRSEEEMKREIASQMEQMITAAVVPLSSIEGISASDSETLAEHAIETIEQLAEATVDDVSEWLDLSVDDAQELLDMAIAITEMRRARVGDGVDADPTSPETDEAAEEDAEETAEETEDGDASSLEIEDIEELETEDVEESDEDEEVEETEENEGDDDDDDEDDEDDEDEDEDEDDEDDGTVGDNVVDEGDDDGDKK